MTKSKVFFATFLALAILLAGPASSEEGWCFASFKENPKSVFGFIASFSLELTARENNGQISEEDYKQAMQDLQDANAAFARLESALGCQKIEAIDTKFQLRPSP